MKTKGFVAGFLLVTALYGFEVSASTQVHCSCSDIGCNGCIDIYTTGEVDNFIRTINGTIENRFNNIHAALMSQTQAILAADEKFLADQIAKIGADPRLFDETYLQAIQNTVEERMEAKYKKQIDGLLQAVIELKKEVFDLQGRLDSD